jgi:DNA modification methylase
MSELQQTLINGCCLAELPRCAAESVDFVIADLPYGMTRNTWDCRIDLQKFWPEIWRVTKRSAAVALFAAPPFDKLVAVSQPATYRYDWVWEKSNATGHLNASRMPLRAHENICVFYREQPTYNPQKTSGHLPVNKFYSRHSGYNYGLASGRTDGGGSTERYPRTVQRMASDKQRSNHHPSQKPLALIRYLIRTYTNPGDMVLDPCMGSGTASVASVIEGRRFIGIEKDASIFAAASGRLARVERGQGGAE